MNFFSLPFPLLGREWGEGSASVFMCKINYILDTSPIPKGTVSSEGLNQSLTRTEDRKEKANKKKRANIELPIRIDNFNAVHQMKRR